MRDKRDTLQFRVTKHGANEEAHRRIAAWTTMINALSKFLDDARDAVSEGAAFNEDDKPDDILDHTDTMKDLFNKAIVHERATKDVLKQMRQEYPDL